MIHTFMILIFILFRLLIFDALVIIWFLWIVICYFIKMHSTQIDIGTITVSSCLSIQKNSKHPKSVVLNILLILSLSKYLGSKSSPNHSEYSSYSSWSGCFKISSKSE